MLSTFKYQSYFQKHKFRSWMVDSLDVFILRFWALTDAELEEPAPTQGTVGAGFVNLKVVAAIGDQSRISSESVAHTSPGTPRYPTCLP